jgi:hypothetical protein
MDAENYPQQLYLSPSETAKARLGEVVKAQETLVADVKVLIGMLPSSMTDEQSFAVQRLTNFILKQT